MRLLTILAVAVGGSLLALLVMLVFKAQASKEGQAVGLIAGSLSQCSAKPNCVNSEPDTPADKYVAPLALLDEGAQASWQRLQQAITEQGGSLVTVEQNYLAATYSSSLFGFVDDLEARLDADAQQIELRSASRVGTSDLGANRTRIELLRRLYQGH